MLRRLFYPTALLSLNQHSAVYSCPCKSGTVPELSGLQAAMGRSNTVRAASGCDFEWDEKSILFFRRLCRAQPALPLRPAAEPDGRSGRSGCCLRQHGRRLEHLRQKALCGDRAVPGNRRAAPVLPGAEIWPRAGDPSAAETLCTESENLRRCVHFLRQVQQIQLGGLVAAACAAAFCGLGG